MRKKAALLFLILAGSSAFFPGRLRALESSFSGNFVVPELQSGFEAEQYEVKVGRKAQRGLENFFLGWLEIPQGVKREFAYRNQEYLPAGIETFFVGAFKGFFRGMGRTAVGVYEVFTCPYPQPPVMTEMGDWLY